MTDTGPVRLAIVGAGAIAEDYAISLRNMPERYQVVGVLDTEQDARESFAARHQVDTFSSIADLAATQPEAALVATPPASHHGLSIQLLEHQIHVLCEKPIALHSGAASRMLQTASHAGRTLMMASKFRYVADVQQAVLLLAEGIVGDVVLFENTFCSRVAMAERWNSQPLISGGGVWIDNGTHAADLVRCLIGPLHRVLVTPCRRVQPIGVEDTVRILMEAGTGAMGVADLSWSLHKEIDTYFSVQGSTGVLQLGWKQSRYKRVEDTSWTVFGTGYDKREALSAQMRNFAAVIRGQEPPAIRPEDAIESVRVVEAGYRSLRSGRFASVHVQPGEQI